MWCARCKYGSVVCVIRLGCPQCQSQEVTYFSRLKVDDPKQRGRTLRGKKRKKKRMDQVVEEQVT